MKRCLKMMGLLAVALALSANSSIAQNKTRAEIEAACKKVCQLYEKKDFKAIAAMMTSDVKFTVNGQTFGKKEWLEQSEMMAPQLKNVKMSFKILQFNQKGNTVTAVSDWSMKADAVGPDGKSVKLDMVERSKDVFVKQGGKWMMKSSTTINQTMK